MNDTIKSDASKLLYLHKDGVRKEKQRMRLGQLLQTAENHSRLRFDAVYVIVRHCNHHFLTNIVIFKICPLLQLSIIMNKQLILFKLREEHIVINKLSADLSIVAIEREKNGFIHPSAEFCDDHICRPH